jgi:N-acetyl-anhydromuramyl-L-alanine amidase AmpD
MNWKKLKSVDYIVVHGSETKDDKDIGVEEIRRSHRQKGWLDVGFHFIIRRDGEVERGRPHDVPGAHVRGYNHVSLGICLVGQTYTDVQMKELRVLILDLLKLHPEAKVCGRRDMGKANTHNPGFDVGEWFNN